ncbi:Hsp20/alpha crystallin family protein [Candidatus Vesicomyidisocius sp. SY067_SCS001]|uniref:Hsp20/alpha crystallin family protein n=1 Tax=Candidatus Vesicomyidisocius sp. SY067_SCS001 TaxID=2732590 RepID=UPI001EEF36E4|nr:Hsp20/alpha crystallin family protein [Candidatus Vesicomyosocius sp. SY067_SCS001]
MYKILLSILLISSTINANNNHLFNSTLFDNNFIWHDFEQKFKQLHYKINQTQNYSNLRTQSRRYFDNQTNSFIIQIKVNGISKENLNIYTNNNIILIKWCVKKVQSNNHSLSTSSSSFFQKFTLPDDVDTNNINASLDNNILNISIPKLKQKKPQEVQKISIQ